MKAILLAAGYGTRLRPLTKTIPKCLMPIKGKPLLEIWIENLIKIGVVEILINTHYLNEIVENYILGSKYANYIKVFYEKNLLGTAGTLLANLDFLENEDCILIHSDNYCEQDLIQFIIAHKNRPKSTFLTMMTFITDNPKNSGIVEINNDNILINFFEKVTNPPSNIANAAVYILTKQFIDELIVYSKNEKLSDFSTQVLHKFLGKIYTYKTNSIFIDIGTIENYNKIK